MMIQSEPKAVSFSDEITDLQTGLHTPPDSNGNLKLIAHRCEDCGTRCFPKRMRCVSCYGDNLVAAELGRIGKVDAFTIVRQAPPGYLGHTPYVLAMVLVDNDIITLCHLLGKDVGSWKRGDAVASCEFVLPVEPNKELKRTFAFRPAEEQ